MARPESGVLLQPTSEPVGLRRCVFALIALLACQVVSSQATAFDELPSIAGLIAEAEAAHAAHAEESGVASDWCLSNLASAKSWQGDIEGALSIARSIEGLWGEVTAIDCVAIHLKRTGEMRELPESIFAKSKGVSIGHEQHRLDLAKKLYSLDRPADAAKLLPEDDNSVLSTINLTDFHLHAGEHALSKEDRDDARQHFLKAVSLLERKPERRNIRDGESFTRAARRLAAVNDPNGVQRCFNSLERKLRICLRPENLKEYNGTTNPDCYLVKAWARLGTIAFLLGDRPRSNDEFRYSLTMLDEVGDREAPADDLELQRILETALEVAVWQCEAALTKEGQATISQALKRSSGIEDDLHRQALITNAVETCCKTGDLDAARNAVAKLNDNYWKGSAPGPARTLGAGGKLDDWRYCVVAVTSS